MVVDDFGVLLEEMQETFLHIWSGGVIGCRSWRCTQIFVDKFLDNACIEWIVWQSGTKWKVSQRGKWRPGGNGVNQWRSVDGSIPWRMEPSLSWTLTHEPDGNGLVAGPV